MATQALAQNVAYVPGIGFFPNGNNHHCMRLNYSCMPDDRIEEGIKRLGNVIRENLKVRAARLIKLCPPASAGGHFCMFMGSRLGRLVVLGACAEEIGTLARKSSIDTLSNSSVWAEASSRGIMKSSCILRMR